MKAKLKYKKQNTKNKTKQNKKKINKTKQNKQINMVQDVLGNQIQVSPTDVCILPGSGTNR